MRGRPDDLLFVPKLSGRLLARRECQRLGKRAHRILDYAIEPDWRFPSGVPMPNAPLYVKTPRFGWHVATTRERTILRSPPHNLPIWAEWKNQY